MTKAPCLSVVMPALKPDGFFCQTFDSLLRQTFTDFELLICCPEDQKVDFLKVVERFNCHVPVKIIGTKLPGISYAANRCIDESSGFFIARWDADDLCDNDRFSRQLEFLAKHPEVAIVGTRVILIDENNQRIKNQSFKFFETNSEIRRALRFRQPLLHSSLTFRKEVLFSSKGYLYGNTSEDHELFLRIARNKHWCFHNLATTTTCYRRREDQLSQRRSFRKQFADIAGFLTTEFILTLNPAYLFGIIANSPAAREIRRTWRQLKLSLSN